VVVNVRNACAARVSGKVGCPIRWSLVLECSMIVVLPREVGIRIFVERAER
jgi:hypothetical protein